jgi:internalin A
MSDLEKALALIEKEKLEKTGELDFRGYDLTELPKEIKELVWLQKLDCSITKIDSLEPISSLSNLQYLNCSSTKIDSLEPISSLSNLQILSCSSTKIDSLEPISSLSNLQQLDCSSTKIDSLEPISSLSNLQQLDCSSTKIDSLEPISSLSNLQILSCSSTKIDSLEPISSLSNLQQLDCSSTKIDSLEPISSLSNLQYLNCSSTKIDSLEPISSLSNLQQLDCSSTKIDSLEPISSLSNLQQLDCSSTKIDSLEPISSLSNLQQLDCSSTKIDSLEPISSLSNLQQLDCSSTKIDSLEPISSLSNLQQLDCSSTKIDSLEPISSLSNLQGLFCYSTKIDSLEPISSLSNLQQLFCSSTKIDSLEPISSLSNLQQLFCSSTKIDSLEPIIRINSNQELNILAQNSPLITPPIEFVQHGYKAIKEYFSQIQENAKNLNEVKIIFLGEGASGKTSLIKRLRNEEFDSHESQTHGIRIRKTPFKINEESLSAHLWDFGGQEVMHATHQFFLSQRCIYVIVLDSRINDKAEYWLKYASSFGGKSPVLVILNKIDENPSFDVNRKFLSEKYPKIHSYHHLSCKNKQGIVEFKQSLTEVINQSDTRRTPFPSTWLAVKEHFADMEKDYIESSEYHQICKEKAVNKAISQDVLLQFMHDLGVIINFRNLKNFDTQILNPLWLTNGVYRIINSDIVVKNKGILNEDDFDKVINEPRYTAGNTTEKNYHYPRNKLHYIVRVMQEFELCFQLDERQYIVPQLLPVQEPYFKFQGTKLHFEIHFPELLPDSIFPRLMVKLHTFIKDELRWRSGMILEKLNVFNATARIRADKEDKKIRIDVYGEEPRRFLSFIRETLKEIYKDFTNLNFEEMVPIPDNDEFLLYKALIKAEKAGKKELYVWQVDKDILIADLLDGVEEAAMRNKSPVKAFISYSCKDIDHLKTLDAALSPLKRLKKLELWYDRAIDAGSDWEKDIFQKLDEADIVLCLVSQDFINSDFCYEREFTAVLKQHHKGEKIVVPIQLRKCHWDNLDLAKIQGIPGKWITSQPNQDEAWTEVAKSLDPIIDKVKQKLSESNKWRGLKFHFL